jgi:hypothetical protein
MPEREEFPRGGLFTAVTCDPLDEPSDAIVNAANGGRFRGAGAVAPIAEAAGPGHAPIAIAGLGSGRRTVASTVLFDGLQARLDG